MQTKATDKPLPNRLREKRLDKGFTLKDLADHLDVSPQAIHNAETIRTSALHRTKWYKLADLFECDPREFEAQ